MFYTKTLVCSWLEISIERRHVKQGYSASKLFICVRVVFVKSCLFVKNSANHQVKKISCIYSSAACQKSFCSQTDQPSENTSNGPFDESLLKVLVCPISKKPLRYDQENNELVSDSIGVAFPIKNGIPNLVPQDGRMLGKSKETDQ